MSDTDPEFDPTRRDFTRRAALGGLGVLGGASLIGECAPSGEPRPRSADPDRAAGTFDVREFGAEGDGSTDDTSAVQAAVNAAAESGDGAPVCFPEGRYRVRRISVPGGVSLTGTTVDRSVIQGTGDGAVIEGREGWVRQRFRHLQVTHEADSAASGVPLLDQKYGARRCEFKNLKLVGVDGASSHGIRLRGEHPERGRVGLDDSESQGVFYNILRNVHCRTSGGYLRSDPGSVAFYLEGTTTEGGRANLNLLERCHVAGWGTGFRLDEGHDNVFLNCKQEDTGSSTSFPRFHLEIRSLGRDSVTHDNLVIAQSFDAANPGQRVRLHNERIQHHPVVVTFIGGRMFDPARDVTCTTGSSTEETPKYQAFGVAGGNRISDRDATSPAGNRSARIGGSVDDGVVSLDGGPAQDSGRFIAAARHFTGTVEAVSRKGGASVSIRDDPEAQFRLVKTDDGSRYRQVWAVDRRGVLDYRGRMGSSSRSPTTTEPDDWIEVKIDGETHYVPAYRP